MAVNRKPGEKMYIDWVGDQPGLLTDVTTGEIMRVHIFATTLGVSSMIYAEAFPNEKLPCFIEGCVHAVSFYGAVAKHFVPDNLKTAVTKHTKDDLVLQSTFSDLEDFYDTIVLPPPARKPKGKPTVENHVRYLETHLIEKLKENIYTSFEDLNADIKKIVAVLNARPFQNQAFSRHSHLICCDSTSERCIIFNSVFVSTVCLTFVNNHCLKSGLLLYFNWCFGNRSPLLLSAVAFPIAVRKATISAKDTLHHPAYLQPLLSYQNRYHIGITKKKKLHKWLVYAIYEALLL